MQEFDLPKWAALRDCDGNRMIHIGGGRFVCADGEVPTLVEGMVPDSERKSVDSIFTRKIVAQDVEAYGEEWHLLLWRTEVGEREAHARRLRSQAAVIATLDLDQIAIETAEAVEAHRRFVESGGAPVPPPEHEGVALAQPEVQSVIGRVAALAERAAREAGE